MNSKALQIRTSDFGVWRKMSKVYTDSEQLLSLKFQFINEPINTLRWMIKNTLISVLKSPKKLMGGFFPFACCSSSRSLMAYCFFTMLMRKANLIPQTETWIEFDYIKPYIPQKTQDSQTEQLLQIYSPSNILLKDTYPRAEFALRHNSPD